MSFEENLQNSLFSNNPEKTYIDKLLAKNEVERTKELIRKAQLSREEILELLHMCSSAESKLVNYSEWDRYVILKFFVWIREFVKVAEIMFDMRDDLTKREENGEFILSDRSKQMLLNNERMISHNTKFLVELFFSIMRTTLSVGGTGFLELLKNKFEMSYPQQYVNTPINSGSGFKLFNRGKTKDGN